MSAYTIGLILEGVVALALIVAIVAVAINKRKPAKEKNPELNGLSGYIEGSDGEEKSTEALLLEGQTAEMAEESGQGAYGYAEQAYEQPPVQEQYAAPEQSGYGYAEQAYEQPPVQEQYAAPAQEPDAAPARGDAAQGSDARDDDLVSFRSVERTFEDAFAELSEEQKRYFSEIMAYALSKPKAEEKVTKGAVCVRSNKKLILKLKIRRKITVASFKLENDLLRDYRHNIGDASAIRMRETEIYVTDDSVKETAFGMIDLMLEQYERERQEALERRRLARAAKRAEQAADRAAEEAAAADAAAEDENSDAK